MTATNTERCKEVVGQLRAWTMWVVTMSLLLGGRLALDRWKKQEDFYPLLLVVLGFLTLTYARLLFQSWPG